jgi:hypothetical protein
MPHMLSAHLAPPLIAKALRPDINLFAGILLCFLPDILHSICVFLGVERLRVDERYSHALITVLFMSFAVFVICRFLDLPVTPSIIYAGIVLSHFLLDLVNRRKMAVTPWGPYIPGIGLHERSRILGFAVELSMVLISVGIFAVMKFNGELASLRLPALLLLIMLILEAFYFRIYFPDVKGLISSRLNS